MKRRMKQASSLWMVMGILLGLNSGVFAGPDLPVVSDRGDGYKEATFTGNQSAGISLVSSWSSAPYISFNVHDLTTDITPASSVDGILLSLWGGNGGDGTDFFGGNAGAGRAAARLWSPLDVPWYWGPELTFSGGGHGIVTSGSSADAIGIFSTGGRGGTGGWSAAGEGGHGGTGGRAGLLYVQSYGDLQTSGASSRGLVAQNVGGDGGTGGDANGKGGRGGAGGEAWGTQVISGGSIETAGESAPGVLGYTRGGSGGKGGHAGGPYGEGGAGGAGGMGYMTAVIASGSITTSGDKSPGILMDFQGGAGGAGGDSGGVYGEGGAGGPGAGGGSAGFPGLTDSVLVQYEANGSIATSGVSSPGISAQSQGGRGGNGGHTGGLYAGGGDGGAGGNALPVEIQGSGSIDTAGDSSPGILALSQGGAGGNGGTAGGAYAAGGDGGAGGSGGSVRVATSAGRHITTAGAAADGISAQSRGGAGGDGGTGGGAVGQGGGTRGSGPGGSVQVINNAGIVTSGPDSRGIFAQSVGGFAGGVGAGAGVVGWGGGVNSAGNGGTIAVTNQGAITVTGGSAETGDDRELVSGAILAQSIGGGGGDAAGSYGLVALGGKGSAGGSGNTVTVENHGSLQTSGSDTFGILAQSVGAGGGSGGSSYAFAALGGTGNSTGHGGAVHATNAGAVATTGDGSAGILAESIGGGGGVVGGYGGKAYSPMMTWGGSGGSGGDGGAVSVTNSGALETSGIDASGIFAQSIGGGGGTGGRATDVALGIALAIGGESAQGGRGGQVDVVSEGAAITTAGHFSHGVRGTSIGGGGGNGGRVASYTAGAGFTGNVAIGGRGGGGGDGGVVNLTNASTVTTQGQYAHGLYAESIGGGGGSGGNAAGWTFNTFIPGAELPSVSFGYSIGGKAGAGGSGRAVTVNNTGDLSTSASHSYGVLAQSVGGGGGLGGNAMHSTVAINSWSVMASVGGEGGEGGEGGSVTVDSAGRAATQGDFAYGILAQSVGGGGGAGGNSNTFLADIGFMTSWTDLLEPSVTCNLLLGGRGGGGGDGGSVVVNSSGPIDTQGEFAHGVLAQSIGGGGGAVGDCTNVTIELSANPQDYLPFVGFMNIDATLVLGGGGGSGGNGGSVRVTNHDAVTTRGDFATGILAQSVGGGGGAAGYVRHDVYCLSSPTAPAVLQLSGGGGGDGGDVTVENGTDIATHAGFAHGILAQSVGGGGGLAGISEEGGWSCLVGPLTYGFAVPDNGSGAFFAGSAGGEGSAGAVSVAHTGNITTHGDISHGILAQSAAGRNGTSGPVSVTVAGAITTYGADSDSIYAQSVGGAGRGNISLSLDGIIRGGSDAGTGVHIDGGADNMLVNHGNLSALSGTAIRGSGGNDIVENHGTVVGGVHLGAGSNAFNNSAGARFDTGAIIDLGVGNALTNAGILSPGGLGAIVDTTLIGDLILSESSVLEIEIAGFMPGTFDSLDVTGSVTGGGEAGMMGLMDFTPTMGGINFSFLSGFDPVAEMDPGGSVLLPFLTADSPVDLALMSYTFTGGPSGFWYDVLQQDSGLFLQAVYTGHTIPAPGALLLGSIGLGLLGWDRRRMRR